MDQNRFRDASTRLGVNSPYFLATVILAVIVGVSLVLGVVAAVSLVFRSNEIMELKTELASVSEDARELRSEVRRNSNPIIRTPGMNGATIYYKSSRLADGSRVTLSIQDGKIMICNIDTTSGSSSCQIDGITEDVYKVVDVNFGNESDDNLGIGLITWLGALYYIRTVDLINSKNVTVSGKISFEQPLNDVLTVLDGGDDYSVSPLLIFRNNSYRKLKREEVGL